MASRAYENNYKAWILEAEPAGWDTDDGGVVTATELDAGTRLLRIISAGGITYTYNENSASQALLDSGFIGHEPGTQEVTGGQIIHEVDFPKEDDTMFILHNDAGYGAERWLVVCDNCQTDEPPDEAALEIFPIKMGRLHTPSPAQDTKRNMMVNWFCHALPDFRAAFDDESTP